MSAMSRDPVTHGTHDPPQMMTADHIITAPHRGKHRHRHRGETIEFLICEKRECLKISKCNFDQIRAFALLPVVPVS